MRASTALASLAMALWPAVKFVSASEEEGGEEEEEEEVDPEVEATTVMLILTVMVVFSVCFEKAKENLIENTRADLLPVLNSLFGELTLLGFIGLILFIMDKLEVVHTVSEKLYHEEGYIGELCESVHMALFMVMLIFLGTVIMMVHQAGAITNLWKSWEENILDEDGLRRGYASMDKASLMNYMEPTQYKRAVYAVLRRQFLKETHIAPQFDFANYLIPLLGHCLAEVVEVPVSTWAGLELVMIIGYILYMILDASAMGFILFMLGYSLPLAMRVIHLKIRHIKFDCAYAANLGDIICSDRELEDHILRASSARMGVGAERAGLLAGAGAGGPVSTQGGSIEKSASPGWVLPANPFASILSPSRYDLDSLLHFYGRSNYEREHHPKRFWMGHHHGKEAPDFTIDLIRYTLLLNSIYVAVFLLMILPKLLAAVSAGSMGVAACVFMFLVALLPAYLVMQITPSCVKDFVIVSNILNMRNNRVVEQGIRRMKTRNAFLSLKVAYMMIKGCVLEAEHIHKKLHTTETATSFITKRAVWKQIFDVFDEDGGGDLEPHEIKSMLASVCGSVNAELDGQLNKVLDHLDRDKDGKISFEEFFEYALKISDANYETPEEVSNGIFDLVDQGSKSLIEADDASHQHGSEDEEEEEEDEIDIAELQDALKKMKQDLSADDVYSIIKDIDEDGNGRLNKEEFMMLLERLDVI